MNGSTAKYIGSGTVRILNTRDIHKAFGCSGQPDIRADKRVDDGIVQINDTLAEAMDGHPEWSVKRSEISLGGPIPDHPDLQLTDNSPPPSSAQQDEDGDEDGDEDDTSEPIEPKPAARPVRTAPKKRG